MNIRNPITRAEIEASPMLTAEIQRQASKIRAAIAANGEAIFAGPGYHRDLMAQRDFAFRVLIAKGELTQDSNDCRRFFAA